MSDWTRYQTDYLFLLVGANPLPNYVAALLLVKDGGTVYLLHSGGAHGTGQVADRLKQAIQNQRPQTAVIPREVNEADAHQIAQKVKEILITLSKLAGASVGLHYTGGTKAMAVHVYRTIEKAFPSAVFSYLDARTLSLMIDGRDTPTNSIPVGQACTVELAELVSLHGYDNPDIQRTPFQPDFCRALAEIHSNSDTLRQWQSWLGEKELELLPDVSQYPLLKGVLQALEVLCGGSATPEQVARSLGQEDLEGCRKWLRGEWLEEYVLWAITQIADKCGIGDYSIDVNLKRPRGHEFQLDVAAMRGYQLFAISCMASEQKEKCKEHLLEAYVRARQMGGDEARVGLVCCYRDPRALQQEIEETWFTEGRVRVFGMTDLLDLPGRLQAWFETANDPRRA